MKIVLYEMKKIWNIKLLLIITGLCVLFFFMFMHFYIKHFPNGHPETEEIDYSIQMIKQYGTTLEPEEYKEFIVKAYGEISSQMEAYIKNNAVFSAAGIYTLADFEKVYQKSETTQLEDNAIKILLGEESDFLLFKLQALNSIEEAYHADFNYTLHTLNEKEQLRLTKIQYTGKYNNINNIMSGWVIENTVMYTMCFSVLVILAVLVLIAPIIITDRTQNIYLLQYTSKNGRKIFNQQFAAVILSAFFLTSALIFIFGAIYSLNGTKLFVNNGLISFIGFNEFWFDITYGQYILLCVMLLYLLCLGTAGIAFVLSRYSSNIISLILKLIPAFAALWALCFGVFCGTFGSGNPLYRQTKIYGIEPIVCSLLFAAGLAASFYILHREKKIDIL